MVRTHVALVRFAATTLVFGSVSSGFSNAAQSQILETHADTLTTYRAPKTIVQDVRPRHEQRGLNLEGSERKRSGPGMALAGNPFENAFSGQTDLNDVQLDTGTWSPTTVDLALPGPNFTWTIGRTFNARQEDSGHHDSDGYQGVNWFQVSQPEIVLYDHPTDNTKDVLYLVYGADRYAEFVRASATSNQYKAKNGAAGCFSHTTGTPDIWEYTDQKGVICRFFGFNTANYQADGQFWYLYRGTSSGAEQIIWAGHPSVATSAVTAGYDTSGRIKMVVDSADRRYTYNYSAPGNRLSGVVVSIKAGGTWDGTPIGILDTASVEYTYYGDSEPHGQLGDLKTVKTIRALSDGVGNDIRARYYRYWTGTYNSATNPGHPHQIKLVLDHEGARKFDYVDTVFDDDFLTATTDNLKPYAAAYFEYDSARRIVKNWSNGECGCSGTSSGTNEYRYETNGSYTDQAGYDTTWARRTSVKRPDNTWITQYFDETGQGLHHVTTDADPANTSLLPGTWAKKVTRDSAGRVTEVSTPANVSAYTHSTGTLTAESSVGLVRVWTRVSSGDMTGFVAARKYKTGTGGSAIFEDSMAWTSFSKSITDVTVVRPLISVSRSFASATTTETGYNETVFAYTQIGSTLSYDSRTTTWPAVSTANNGSGGTTTRKEHYTPNGEIDFEKDEASIVTFFKYTKGSLELKIDDANTYSSYFTANSISIPTGFESTGGGVNALHQVTNHAYDGGGGSTTTTPDGNATKKYKSKLKDRRLVTLEFPSHAPGTAGSNGWWSGPATYRVINHAHKVEVDAVVAVKTGGSTANKTTFIDENDSDPILAVDTDTSFPFDFGQVAQMRTYIYDSAGVRLNAERSYFLIPDYGAGTDGTNYDETLYGYDDIGRQKRVKEAHGTITRTVYDSLGRVVARWTGTNDSSFPGGQPGTDNMVKTEDLVYDGGQSGGNSYLTSRTKFVQDNPTGQRQAVFANDVRGHVLLVTNPLAPHYFAKRDNLGRVTALGMYSSVAGFSLITDDPTSKTSNRVGLAQWAFDEKGEMWRERIHKIDVSDGSDDDSIDETSWRNERGAVCKIDGTDALTKLKYDALGRLTHWFTLAADNDTNYADSLSADNDQVISEEQIAYDSAGDVIVEAQIDRYHSDKGGSSTSGPLDDNADINALAFTYGNIKGRIQISASWYDDLGRLQDRVEYGTFGGSTFNRDGLPVPARSDIALRTTWSYNDDGTVKEIEDPRGLKQRFEYDALGRQTKSIANFDDGIPGGPNGDEDQVVLVAYTDGLQTTLTADIPDLPGQLDQVTTYLYGTAKGSSAGDSKIATGHLLQKVTYPDSTNSDDVVRYAYNALDEPVWAKDQAGNVLEFDYDLVGRMTHRRVTTLDVDFDGAVRRISSSFNSRGQRELVTQYDSATVGSGNVVDETKASYDGWGNLVTFEQDRNSAVGASGSVDDYEVGYGFEKQTTGRNTLRRTNQSLTGGRTFSFSYRSTAGLFDGAISRVTQITDNGTPLATYDYLGVGGLVGTKLEQPLIMWKKYTTAPGDYSDLDLFNRITTCEWSKELTPTTKDLFKSTMTWDRNSNVVTNNDHVFAKFDAWFDNDKLDRLIESQEGPVTSLTVNEKWTLSQTGTWEHHKLDLNSDNDLTDPGELNDDRTFNAANELLARDTDDNGTNNFTLAKNEVGAITDDGESYEYVWDPFGRLRRINTRGPGQSLLVAEYKYNGHGFRISAHEDTDSSGGVTYQDKWFHYAYDEQWRIVGVYRENDTSPKEQYLYHAAGEDGRGASSYLDSVVLRDRDRNTVWTEPGDGTLEERNYYLQNWRSDVVALVSATGAQIEQVRYSPYGTPFGLPAGDCDGDGDCDSVDSAQVGTWITSSQYDVRGDIDLDGDVDTGDQTTVNRLLIDATTGRGVLSKVAVGNMLGHAGSRVLGHIDQLYARRHRIFDTSLGQWMSRDPIEYDDGVDMYQYVSGMPLSSLDSYGLKGDGFMARLSRLGGQAKDAALGAGKAAAGALHRVADDLSHGFVPFSHHTLAEAGLFLVAPGLIPPGVEAWNNGRDAGNAVRDAGHGERAAEDAQHCVGSCSLRLITGSKGATAVVGGAHELYKAKGRDKRTRANDRQNSRDDAAANKRGRDCGKKIDECRKKRKEKGGKLKDYSSCFACCTNQERSENDCMHDEEPRGDPPGSGN